MRAKRCDAVPRRPLYRDRQVRRLNLPHRRRAAELAAVTLRPAGSHPAGCRPTAVMTAGR